MYSFLGWLLFVLVCGGAHWTLRAIRTLLSDRHTRKIENHQMKLETLREEYRIAELRAGITPPISSTSLFSPTTF